MQLISFECCTKRSTHLQFGLFIVSMINTANMSIMKETVKHVTKGSFFTVLKILSFYIKAEDFTVCNRLLLNHIINKLLRCTVTFILFIFISIIYSIVYANISNLF